MINPLVSVLAITNKPQFINRVYLNFDRQKNINKELILVLNSSHFNLKEVKAIFSNIKNVFIFELPEEMSLGACLNFAICKSHGEYLTKLDDDDHYGPNYLEKALSDIVVYNADLIGYSSFYVYLEEKNQYYIYQRKTLRTFTRVSRYSPNIIGSTLFWHNRVTSKINYRNIFNKVDFYFVKDAIASDFIVLGTFSDQYIRYREKTKIVHTDKSSDLKKFLVPRLLGFFRQVENPSLSW